MEKAEVENYKQNEVVLLRMAVLGPVTQSQAVSMLSITRTRELS